MCTQRATDKSTTTHIAWDALLCELYHVMELIQDGRDPLLWHKWKEVDDVAVAAHLVPITLNIYMKELYKITCKSLTIINSSYNAAQ